MRSPRPGVVFTEAVDGDVRGDAAARAAVSRRLGIPDRWATAGQVHGARVALVSDPGEVADTDALATDRPRLPLAVFTADCMGVVVVGDRGVGVAHAGWRGMAKGVVAALVGAMEASGMAPRRAFCGPTIGPCCFEVGPEVAAGFPGSVSSTTWGTTSVDLWAAVGDQVPDLELSAPSWCTMHHDGFFSHRGSGAAARMAAIGWLEGVVA